MFGGTITLSSSEKNALATYQALAINLHANVCTHVFPKVDSDLFGNMIRKHTHDAAQHLSNSFQDFHARRCLTAHGASGSLSNTLRFGDGAADGGGFTVDAPFCFSEPSTDIAVAQRDECGGS